MKSVDQSVSGSSEIPVTDPLSREESKRLAKNIRSKSRYEKMKQIPGAYKAFLDRRRENAAKRHERLDDKTKAEHRLQHARATAEYERRKKEKDPTYKKYDARTGIRKRVREGTATEEDK
ncbi:uncharacterized protein FA14DRAFT_158440 [Meira miltonrushii]|uniref:Uncharacterized protein n=1 Tax=Meira miltonrushii TaxID=1280837 RepID=A0A316V3Q5_9BASI|nr:uncharacterized protein FA14DRAFT_158440 [Meira miltonrushii]PWN31628.1 hypothetical protein FA14DRAFT_158440 [Meira miltonrushii]